MKAIILAAGDGKRMKSDLPKILHTVAGKPMLHCVIEACLQANIEDITVVVGKKRELIVERTPYPVSYVTQEEQLGTGHAVLCAKQHFTENDDILVLPGDAPLITSGFLKNLIKFYHDKEAKGVVVATTVPEPFGYGRVFTDGENFEQIIEHKDLAANQHSVNLINTAIYMSTGRELLYGLERIKNNNNQNEYYLTDVPKIVKDAGHKVLVYNSPDYTQFLGINSQKQLAEASLQLRSRIIDKHFENGVQIIDPTCVHIEADVQIEAGAILHPGVIIKGKSHICKAAVIGPYSQITDSFVGAETTVSNSVLESAKVGCNCQVGPYAYLRAGAVVGDRCRVGDFVEIKNATLGNDTKAAHLTYIGDAQVGDRVNFGCGSITVNYDGANKHRTVIEDDVFVGSNVNLVAPIVVHNNSYLAAGSTITKEVPTDALAIARIRDQSNIEGWVPERAPKKRK